MQSYGSLVMKQLFTAYGADMPSQSANRADVQYLCTNCGQDFAASWGAANPMNPYVPRGKRYFCPYCGMLHEKFSIVLSAGEAMPVDVQISTIEYTDKLVIKARFRCLKFTGLFQHSMVAVTEEFGFSWENRSSYFRVSNGPRIDIGRPEEMSLSETSLFRYLGWSTMNKNHSAHVTEWLRNIRTAVEKGMRKKFSGFRSVYSPADWDNRILHQFRNIAYRIAFPDLPEVRDFAPWHSMNSVDKESLVGSIPDGWYTKYRSMGGTGAKHIARAMGLPEVPSVTSRIQQDFWSIPLLLQLNGIFTNVDRMVRAFGQFSSRAMLKSIVAQFLTDVASAKGERFAGAALKIPSGELQDTARQYFALSRESRQQFFRAKMKVKEWHDWVSREYRRQERTNSMFSLDVPEEIIRRMSMQTGRLRYYLPKDSMELLEAGDSLHNCVGSYGSAVRERSAWIVLIADDKGKVVGSIEIREGRVVQAKGYCNAPIQRNPELYEATLAWIREKGLAVDTEDLTQAEVKKAV